MIQGFEFLSNLITNSLQDFNGSCDMKLLTIDGNIVTIYKEMIKFKKANERKFDVIENELALKRNRDEENFNNKIKFNSESEGRDNNHHHITML
jgi:hypothetical protein